MIGVVAHDAGGAENISSYVRREGLDCGYCLEGAAVGVFARKVGSTQNRSLENLIYECEWLLCGTSFLAELEWRAIGLARDAGKRSIAFLDHWVNYRQRFSRYGMWNFPDEVWVGDELALEISGATLPNVPATYVPNPYFQDIRDELSAVACQPRASRQGLSVLYVCEPLRDDGAALYGDERHWGYTEEDALRYFLNNLDWLGGPVERIVVRPHPQESRDKYQWAVAEYDLPIVTGESRTLVQQVVESDVVAGCASMAMVVGLLAGKRVVSCIPPGGRTVPLPHLAIERMAAPTILHDERIIR